MESPHSGRSGSGQPVREGRVPDTIWSMRDQGQHYERAFEAFLRSHRIPYVAVDEARRALVAPEPDVEPHGDLKSFDLLSSVRHGAGRARL